MKNYTVAEAQEIFEELMKKWPEATPKQQYEIMQAQDFIWKSCTTGIPSEDRRITE